NRALSRGCGRTGARGRETGRCCPLFSRHFLFRHVQKLRRSRRSISPPGSRFAQMKMIKFRGIFSRKKKLRASTRRATASGAEFDDPSEPNMKLSRALLIVLLLHIVAVAGIIAFNAIKSRQGGMPVISSSHIAKSSTNHEEAKTMQPSSAKTGKKSKTNDPVPEGAKVYTVAKGDNPVNIAKKFKV